MLILLLGSRTGAEFAIEYHWWSELGQLQTWLTMLFYRFMPAVAASPARLGCADLGAQSWRGLFRRSV